MRARFIIGIIAIVLFSTNIFFANPGNSVTPKQILFVYGGWPGHTPEEWKDFFVPWLEEKGYTVVVSNTVDSYLDSSLMAGTDLVIQSITMDKIPGEAAKALLKFVKEGKAIAGWHGGTGDSFRSHTGFQYMIGGQFVAHPGGYVDFTVNVKQKDHPIMKGIEDFHVKSEQYYLHVDPNLNVLATTTFNGENDEWIDGVVMPAVWTKTYGKGKVFYSAPGHNIDDTKKFPEILEIIKRGILWAIGDLK